MSGMTRTEICKQGAVTAARSGHLGWAYRHSGQGRQLGAFCSLLWQSAPLVDVVPCQGILRAASGKRRRDLDVAAWHGAGLQALASRFLEAAVACRMPFKHNAPEGEVFLLNRSDNAWAGVLMLAKGPRRS